MIIGHLPAGYLAAHGAKVLGASHAMFVGILLGSVAPDLDMLWFHFVDHESTHHHHYITHRPIIWASVLLLGLMLKQASILGVGIGGLLHVALDSIAGQIAWLWPFSSHLTTLVEVQPTHSHWILSFLAHWTFKVEIGIAILAALLFWRTNFRKDKT